MRLKVSVGCSSHTPSYHELCSQWGAGTLHLYFLGAKVTTACHHSHPRFFTWVLDFQTWVLMLERQALYWPGRSFFTDLLGHIWLLKTVRPIHMFWHTNSNAYKKEITLEIGKSIVLKNSHCKRRCKPKSYKCKTGMWIENMIKLTKQAETAK